MIVAYYASHLYTLLTQFMSHKFCIFIFGYYALHFKLNNFFVIMQTLVNFRANIYDFVFRGFFGIYGLMFREKLRKFVFCSKNN